MTKRKAFIKSFGCQMNVYDSERMMELLRGSGYEACDNPSDAHLVILNTCHIREKASEKTYSDIGRLHMIKKQKKANHEEYYIAIAGCVAQAHGEEIMRRAPTVDMVFGPQSYHHLPNMIAQLHRGQRKLLNIDFDSDEKFDTLGSHRDKSSMGLSAQLSAFVTIQEGCDKFCSFCVVPYTRGAENSRPVISILDEIKALADNNCREVTLLGQNVNAYHGIGTHGKTYNLASLIHDIAQIDNIDRIRFTTSHPCDMDNDLIAAFGNCDSLMPYLHLPIQSGSNNILKQMNRGHHRDLYLDIIERLRQSCPDIAITSDFIVGYPNETHQDFEDTMDIIRKVNYAGAFSFKYSPRPGTPAARVDDHITEDIKNDRLQQLQAVITQQQSAFDNAQIGKKLPVLIEKPARYDGQMVGRSPYLQPVHINGDKSLIGKIINCHIDDVKAHSLFGTMITDEKPSYRQKFQAAG